jgi:hypothetical protein
MLGLLAMMLAGSVMAGTASAAAGPFWHHRAVGAEGEGAKVEANAPESFKGKGGEQTLTGTFGGETVEVRAPSVQVKGAVFNNSLQGQVKLEIVYNQPEVLKPAAKPCSVVIGAKNIVVVKGHLMWKWNGEAKQLTEEPQTAGQKPDLVFTPLELATGATTLPAGEFTSLTFTGSGCGVLPGGPRKVSGSEVGLPSPANVNEWSKKLAVRTLPGKEFEQHFWNGTAFEGVKAGLEFTGATANLVGQTEVEAAQQELAVFEK